MTVTLARRTGSQLRYLSGAVRNTTPPDAPRGVTLNPGNGKLAVWWLAPAEVGGAAVTAYTVTATASGQSTVTWTGTALGTVLTVANNALWTVTVTAANSAGTGTASAPLTATPLASISDLPVATIVDAFNELCAVSWTVPGGLAVASYTVTATASGQTTATVAAGANDTSALLDRVAPYDPVADAMITWTVVVTATPISGSPVASTGVTVTPTIVKPTAANTGVPVGAAGDIRTPAGTLTQITADALSTLAKNLGDGATVSGYEVTDGNTFLVYKTGQTFRNCRFIGGCDSRGGGVYQAPTFIDCEMDGTKPADQTAVPNAVAGSAALLLRCNVHDFVVAHQPPKDVRYTYTHDAAYRPGVNPPATQSHSDGCQWFNFSTTPATSTGVVIGNNFDMYDGGISHTATMSQMGGWSGLSPYDRLILTWAHNWSDGGATYHFSGTPPAGTLAGDMVYRHNKLGLHAGYGSDMFYPGFRALVTWEANNTWAETGVNARGVAVTAGDVIT